MSLDCQVLLLNSAYAVVDTIPWQRAMILWATRRAEIVETYPDRTIGLANGAMPMPAIIRYQKGLHRYRKGVKFSRHSVFVRDGGRCGYCGVKLTKTGATLDHVVPKSRGGRSRWENIVLSCSSCNGTKRDRTPEEAGMRLLVRPARPESLPNHGPLHRPFDEQHMPPSWRPFLAA